MAADRLGRRRLMDEPGDGLSQPARHQFLYFAFARPTIQAVQRLARVIQRDVPAGVRQAAAPLRYEFEKAAFGAGMRLAESAEVGTGRRILEDELRPPSHRVLVFTLLQVTELVAQDLQRSLTVGRHGRILSARDSVTSPRTTCRRHRPA